MEHALMADCHRPPLYSIEAEQAVLGGLMIDATAWPRIAAHIAADDFYRSDHRIIFAAIAKLQDGGNAIDTTTVADFLDRHGKLKDVGGLAYIGTLSRDTPTAANIEEYAAAVRERSSLRRLKIIGDEIAAAAASISGQTAEELAARAQEQLQGLQSRARTCKGLIDSRQILAELVEDLDARSDGSYTGLRIGLSDFDELSFGLEAGDLVVIGARPGVGKTALAISIASIVSQNLRTAVFSAEMPSQQLMRRCVALQTEISQGRLRRPEQLTDNDWSKIANVPEANAGRKLSIDDTPAPTLTHIRAETLALKSRESLGLVLVDYVQLVRGLGANRYEQLRDVSYGMKALAKELAVPIIVLAQLNREVESRDARRPRISDLRDSGAIEEAADIIGLLYSEGYYDRDFAMPYVLECAIAKNRNGERGECLWRFDGAYSRVSPLDVGAAAQYRRMRIKQREPKHTDL
jgi:replicative DNA helicase